MSRIGRGMNMVLEYLAHRGQTGATFEELAEALARTKENTAAQTRKLRVLGLVVSAEEFNAHSRTELRWWLPEHLPALHRTTAVVDPARLAKHRTGTLDNPWGAVVVAGVIRAAECRPWAAAAAAR